MSNRRVVEPIIDSMVTTPIFVDALSVVSPFGAVTQLIFTARQASTSDGTIERYVQVRLTVPTDQLQTIGRLILSCCDGRTLSSLDEPGESLSVN